LLKPPEKSTFAERKN